MLQLLRKNAWNSLIKLHSHLTHDCSTPVLSNYMKNENMCPQSTGSEMFVTALFKVAPVWGDPMCLSWAGLTNMFW